MILCSLCLIISILYTSDTFILRLFYITHMSIIYIIICNVGY
nr:MAG TPA: hypothetical protein [Caudoviricetes sp.]